MKINKMMIIGIIIGIILIITNIVKAELYTKKQMRRWKVERLKQFIEDRGQQCIGCGRKSELINFAYDIQQLPKMPKRVKKRLEGEEDMLKRSLEHEYAQVEQMMAYREGEKKRKRQEKIKKQIKYEEQLKKRTEAAETIKEEENKIDL
mmetsp:Transcript_10877/g.15957  ORF Transcript_10877/g.15957 Transcript_10877/m.15957 type:complete len:149 (+) Transcript_10877:24-470(+)